MNNIEINPMKQSRFLKNMWSAAVLAGSLLLSAGAYAGPGHDHGDDAPAVIGEKSPRVVMESTRFEAVGILKGRVLEIYIDHAATNKPVHNAKLELTLNGQQVPVELHSEGEFDAQLPREIDEGAVAVAMTVSEGGDIDLLAGELLLDPHAKHEEHEHQHGHDHELGMLLYAAGGLLILGLIVFAVVRLKPRGGR